MNRILIAAALAATVATPAFAQDAAPVTTFTGARVSAEIGLADDDLFGTEAFTYGVDAGYDFDLGAAVAGLTVGLQDTDETGREFFAGGRVGAKVGSNALVYATVGYANLKVFDGLKVDGVRFGLGVEAAPARNFFVKAEQRYTNYELGGEAYQTVIGAGVRF
ncbi:outer membrane beta-barrel protein [Sphingomonas xanthus]|uniref:Porin family protein n=1 Tax=Sphingomonas xanthus TaxID=2594473 RepID=A0A516ISX5_9SPHN|nr:outer membrane beta-barrel protein [Sphingomonas xanthus]QDP20003.1 porin family protein [Sphingomonas xanthus]